MRKIMTALAIDVFTAILAYYWVVLGNASAGGALKGIAWVFVILHILGAIGLSKSKTILGGSFFMEAWGALTMIALIGLFVVQHEFIVAAAYLFARMFFVNAKYERIKALKMEERV